MDWIDYRDKLGIGFNDEKKVQYFLAKIFNVLEDIRPEMDSQISSDEYYTFCNMTGTAMQHGSMCYENYRLILSTLEAHSREFNDFISYYIAFVNCQKDNNNNKTWTKENFKNVICNLLDESHIPYDLIEDTGAYFIFPKGVDQFDHALVSDVLLWLKDYPLTEKAWIKALKAYSESTNLTASETADNFRKALERFFQEFFKSEKSLENLKSEYGTFLSSKGIPAEIKNNFEKLLESYTNYNNNYAKHHDKVSKSVLEYIMYQTGNLMRLLITLK